MMEVQTNLAKSKTGEEKLATFISSLFHPLSMPTYGFLLLFFTRNYISTFTAFHIKILILSATFIFTFLLPAINALILLKMGKIKSLEMESVEERKVPYASAAVYFFSLYYLFHNIGFPEIFSILILGAFISIVLTLIINLNWKISAHTIGIGGIAGAVLGIMYRLQIDLHFIFMCVLFVSGLVGYARLKLKAHSPAQVYVGFLLGFIVELLLMLFY